ncbi:succinylglutamate desuccinylase/aspartoacylase family protein [Bradyrhizobium sp. CCBAU 51753]|uniref:succinylglutamate desuccinylase/aspartoacylase family protein n=1 Tax=Bradyrhizobium sp. CCBAU 51753 TaxID=1325100 RepID=UPI00188AADE0|nr:succinylglutamate desuccinylase/aspartoacylase family protein [Bradyrhizobium sp. CCBAU 51753]
MSGKNEATTDIPNVRLIGVDFDREGKSHGYIGIQHSTTRSCYYWLPVPITCIKNRSGPTVLLISGIHGDEYEGQLALSKLAADLQPVDVTGRVLIVPMANFPAAKAGTRTSPIDGGDLNRLFPGEANGSVTQQIAAYIEHALMAIADFVIDLHSGGSSIMHVAAAIVVAEGDALRFQRQMALAQAFGAPYTIVYASRSQPHFGKIALAASARQGAIAIGAELGGAGSVTSHSLALTEQGLVRVLHKVGVLAKISDASSPMKTRVLSSDRPDTMIWAMEAGLFEPAVIVGNEVRRGDLAGRIHVVDSPGRSSSEYRFDEDGVVTVARFMTQVERGDCLYRIAFGAEHAPGFV